MAPASRYIHIYNIYASWCKGSCVDVDALHLWRYRYMLTYADIRWHTLCLYHMSACETNYTLSHEHSNSIIRQHAKHTHPLRQTTYFFIFYFYFYFYSYLYDNITQLPMCSVGFPQGLCKERFYFFSFLCVCVCEKKLTMRRKAMRQAL
jgi:hypothetical protein